MGCFNPKKKKYEFKIHRVICYDNEEWCKVCISKWTSGIWQFSSEHLKASKIFVLMCSFWTKYILFELKRYKGIIFHETEEGYKIWRGIDLSFQNWYKEFDKFWPEHLNVSKVFTLMGPFRAKYVLFERRKVQRSCLSWNRRGIVNLKRNGIVVSKLTYGIWQVLAWILESPSLKFLTLMGSFSAKYIFFKLKKFRGVIFHHIFAKCEEKLTCCLQNDVKNLANFHQSTEKCQNRNSDGFTLSKVENIWAYNLQTSYVSWQWRMIQKLKEKWIVVLKLTWGT